MGCCFWWTKIPSLTATFFSPEHRLTVGFRGSFSCDWLLWIRSDFVLVVLIYQLLWSLNLTKYQIIISIVDKLWLQRFFSGVGWLRFFMSGRPLIFWYEVLKKYMAYLRARLRNFWIWSNFVVPTRPRRYHESKKIFEQQAPRIFFGILDYFQIGRRISNFPNSLIAPLIICSFAIAFGSWQFSANSVVPLFLTPQKLTKNFTHWKNFAPSVRTYTILLEKACTKNFWLYDFLML